MNSHKEVNIPKIEKNILKISNLVKEVAVFIHNEQALCTHLPRL